MASFLDTLFGGGAETDAANANRAATTQYGTDSQGYLTSGYNTGTGAINSAISAYAPLSSLANNYNAAGTLYTDALGANGASGTANAQAAFTNSPGYQAGIDAGLTGINRAAALSGRADSGNTDVAALTYAQNQQNQQYNTWLQNLQSAGNTGAGLTTNAAAGTAAGYGNLASLAQNYAGSQAGVAGNVATGMTNANDLQAQGEASGAKNLLSAGLSLATLGMGGNPFGGAMGGTSGSSGGTSLLGSLGNSLSGAYQGWSANNPGVAGSAYYGPVSG